MGSVEQPEAPRIPPALARFLRHRLATAGALLTILLIVSAVFAQHVAPRDPLFIDINKRFARPLHDGFLLGSDELGRDLLSRLVHAGRISLTVGFAAMIVSVTAGTLVGTLAAHASGVLDTLLMRFTDVFLSFPSIFLLLALAAFIPPSVMSLALIIGLTAWMEPARLVHGVTSSLLSQEFILAARATGGTQVRIAWRHVIPNSAGPIVVAGTLNVANAILVESYVSYLGYGIQPPLATWGNMLNNAQAYFNSAPGLAIFPGLMIMLAVTSINFVGDGLRDALDPHGDM
jgi:peptide/nickel transport system permease protein